MTLLADVELEKLDFIPISPEQILIANALLMVVKEVIRDAMVVSDHMPFLIPILI